MLGAEQSWRVHEKSTGNPLLSEHLTPVSALLGTPATYILAGFAFFIGAKVHKKKSRQAHRVAAVKAKKSDDQRVVITGMGIVGPYGNDIEVMHQKLMNGESAIRTIDHFDTSKLPVKFAAACPALNIDKEMGKAMPRKVDRFVKYALVAGKNAIEHSNLNSTENLDHSRVGIVMGSALGGWETVTEGSVNLATKGPRYVSPFYIPFAITNMSSGYMAMEFKYGGPNYSLSTACASSNHALLAAELHIQQGQADVILAGGVEASVLPPAIAGFASCQALSKMNDTPEKASRPWDADRNGFVLGEGAGVLVLERLSHAKARGATIYAELHGGGMTCDAYDMTNPHPEGLHVARCFEEALTKSGIAKEQIGYLNCHATSTKVGDLAEAKGAAIAFKEHTQNIYANATKSMIGHQIAAAGATEAIVTIMALNKGEFHGTNNLDNPIDVPFEISKKSVIRDVEIAASSSFGFGGHNGVVVLGKYNQ